MAKSPVVLIIRDGWGINPGEKTEAVANGDAPRKARSITDSPRGSNLARPSAPAHGMRDIPQAT